MTAPFRVSLLLEGDSKGARQALKGVEGEAGRAAAATDRLTKAANINAATVASTGKSAAKAQNDMRMLAYQVNQVGQMYAVSGNLMQAFIIQLPDVLAIAGGLAGALAGGALAIGASLIPALLSGESAARGFEKQIGDANSALDAMDKLSSVSAAAINTYLVAAFHDSAGAVGELLDKLKELQFEAITKQSRGLIEDEVGKIDDMVRAWQQLAAVTARGPNQTVDQRLEAIAQKAGATVAQVTALRDVLASVGTARTSDELTTRLADAYKMAQDLGGPVGDDIARAIETAATKAGILDRLMSSARAATKGMAGAAGSVADELTRAADQAARLAKNKFDTESFLFSNRFKGEETVMGQSLTPHMLTQAQIDAALGHKKTGQSAASARKSIEALIASLKAEGDAIRANDPVQQEMLRYRRQLAAATDSQRETVRQLVIQNVAERQHLEALRQQYEFFGQTAYDALDGLIFQGKSLGDVMGNLAAQIAQAALQAEVLGTGPLASLLGVTPETSLIGGLFGAILPARAGGGPVTGPGGPTDDKVLMWGSNGEFVMNARATQAYRPILEAMNSGIPAFAAGGAIGGGSTTMSLVAPRGDTTLNITVDLRGAQGNSEIAAAARQGVSAAIEAWSREELPQRMREIADDPRRIG